MIPDKIKLNLIKEIIDAGINDFSKRCLIKRIVYDYEYTAINNTHSFYDKVLNFDDRITYYQNQYK